VILLVFAALAAPAALAPRPGHATTVLAEGEYGSLESGFSLIGGIGGYFRDFFRSGRNAKDGSGSGLSLYPVIHLGACFELGDGWALWPAAAWSPLGRGGPEDATSTRVLPISLRLRKALESWEVYAGPGVSYYWISGNGGTMRLSNGSSSTVFGLPDRTVSTRMFTLQLGAGKVVGRLHYNLDFTVAAAFSSARRSADMLLSVGYELL
jgi:hypothetical protein